MMECKLRSTEIYKKMLTYELILGETEIKLYLYKVYVDLTLRKRTKWDFYLLHS